MKSLFLISAMTVTTLSQLQLPFGGGADPTQPLAAPPQVKVSYLVDDPLGEGWFVEK